MPACTNASMLTCYAARAFTPKESHRERGTVMGSQKGTAFVTSRKGFCYLTIKIIRRNYDIMKIRAYTISPQDKRV